MFIQKIFIKKLILYMLKWEKVESRKNYKIIKNSNFPEMNSSVKQMLDTIDRLPPPPNGAITIDANIILTN